LCWAGDEIAKRHSILHRLLKHMDKGEPAFIEPPFTVDYVGMPSHHVQTSKPYCVLLTQTAGVHAALTAVRRLLLCVAELPKGSAWLVGGRRATT